MENKLPSREAELGCAVTRGIQSLISDWLYNEINIFQQSKADKMSVSIVKKNETMPIAFIEFEFESTSVNATVTGFESKANAKASMPIDGGDVNAVRNLMNNDKIKDAIQKALSGVKHEEKPADPNLGQYSALDKLYEALGHPDDWFKHD